MRIMKSNYMCSKCECCGVQNLARRSNSRQNLATQPGSVEKMLVCQLEFHAVYFSVIYCTLHSLWLMYAYIGKQKVTLLARTNKWPPHLPPRPKNFARTPNKPNSMYNFQKICTNPILGFVHELFSWVKWNKLMVIV